MGLSFLGEGVCGVGVWGDRLGSGKKGLGMERLWNGMVKLCICGGVFDGELSFGKGTENTKRYVILDHALTLILFGLR